MIRYTLRCEADHGFEGWFRSSTDFEEQRQRRLLECPLCGSSEVDRGIMAPAVAKAHDPVEAAAKARQLRQFFTQVRKHVEENADYVGDKFPDEARAIHYGDAQERQIYGEASLEDAHDLLEEGIEVLPLPPKDRHDA